MDDYTPVATAPVVDMGSELPTELVGAGYSVTEVYRKHQSSAERVVSFTEMDLGVLESISN